jgi:hypothetical protein
MTVRPPTVAGVWAFAGSAVVADELLDHRGFVAVMVVSARQYLSPKGDVFHTWKAVMPDERLIIGQAACTLGPCPIGHSAAPAAWPLECALHYIHSDTPPQCGWRIP